MKQLVLLVPASYRSCCCIWWSTGWSGGPLLVTEQNTIIDQAVKEEWRWAAIAITLEDKTSQCLPDSFLSRRMPHVFQVTMAKDDTDYPWSVPYMFSFQNGMCTYNTRTTVDQGGCSAELFFLFWSINIHVKVDPFISAIIALKNNHCPCVLHKGPRDEL